MDKNSVDFSEPIIKKRKVSDFLEKEAAAQEIDSVARDLDISDKSIIPIEENSEPKETAKEPHILQSFNPTTLFPNVTERYLTPYYCINEESPGNDTCIWVHSNRICLISLAPSHEVIKKEKKIVSINFKVSDKLDRASNKVSGKSKHGAQPLQPSSTICTIECEDEEIYSVKCNMTGKLMEVNDALVEKPRLLFEPPHRGGYLAIALPNIARFEALTNELLSQERYDAAIAAREIGS